MKRLLLVVEMVGCGPSERESDDAFQRFRNNRQLMAVTIASNSPACKLPDRS